MNLGNDPADQVVRYSMAGTEMALKLSGLAAKNLAIFLVALLKDQKKTRGKTRLVRMLKEGRPTRYFDVPTHRMKEFAKEAKTHGLLFVAVKDSKNPSQHELMVFADDAPKVQRILDRMQLDFVKEEAEPIAPTNPSHTETITTPQGEISFAVGGFEDDFSVAPTENFTWAREKAPDLTAENPSAASSQISDFSMELTQSKPSVKKELEEIKLGLKSKNIPVKLQIKTKGER